MVGAAAGAVAAGAIAGSGASPCADCACAGAGCIHAGVGADGVFAAINPLLHQPPNLPPNLAHAKCQDGGDPRTPPVSTPNSMGAPLPRRGGPEEGTSPGIDAPDPSSRRSNTAPAAPSPKKPDGSTAAWKTRAPEKDLLKAFKLHRVGISYSLREVVKLLKRSKYSFV